MFRIPSHAQKVFSGIIFDVFQWEQEMFDGSKKTFEGARRLSTAIIIPVVEGKIVVIRERQPGKDRYMTSVGGRIEQGEDPLLAAQRELLEETGLVSHDISLYKTFSVGLKLDYQLYYYIAKDCSTMQATALDQGGEDIQLQYLNFDEFIAFIQSGQCKDVSFANHIFRLEKAGTLDDFRRQLLD